MMAVQTRRGLHPDKGCAAIAEDLEHIQIGVGDDLNDPLCTPAVLEMVVRPSL